MADNESRSVIVLEADRAAASATQKAIDDCNKNLQALDKKFQNASAGATDLQKALGKLARAQQLDAIGTEMGQLAKETGDAAKATAELDKRLKALGANKDEIDSVAASFNAAANAQDPNAGRNRLQSLGANIRNLPSVQIPGLGIGTDAIGNLLRVSGALQESLKGQAAATAVTTAASAAATAAEGTQAAANTTVATSAGAAALGVGAIIAATGVLAVVGVAAGVVIAAVSAEAEKTAKSNAALAEGYKASDKIFQEILNGLTTSEAQAKLEDERKELKRNQEELEKAKQENERLAGEVRKNNPFLGAGTYIAQFQAATGTGALEATTKRQAELNQQILENTANIEEYTAALEGNELATNDAKEAEKKRQEEVEKSQKELEALQKRGAEADLKFAQKREDDARGATQKREDIDTNAEDKRADIQQKAADERKKLAEKISRDESDARLKSARLTQDAQIQAYQDEIDAQTKQARTLQDIRESALRDEEDQLRSRNFLGASLASEAAQRQLQDAALNAQREGQDRAVQRERDAFERALDAQREAMDRKANQARARADLNTSLAQQQRDAQTAYERQIRDADLQYERLQETTQLNYDREKEALQKQMDELLGIRVEEAEKEKALAAGASPESVLRSTGGSSSTSNSTSITDNRSFGFTGSTSASNIEAFRRLALETMRATRYG